MQDTSFWVAPIPEHAFFEKTQFERLLGHNLLQITRLHASEPVTSSGRCWTGCIARQTLLPGLHEVL